MNDPLVTVSIPSYNHAEWLSQAIESVLGQTYRNIELLLVDDASSDDSLEIAQGYAAAYPDRIRVLTHPDREHRGISATVNRAIAEARGKYWGGLASDDMLLPQKVERQVELLEADPELIFVYAYSGLVDAEGRRIPGKPLGEDMTQFARPLERQLGTNCVYGITALVRVSALRAPPPITHREELIYSDWDLWIRLIARGPVAFLPETVACSRLHAYNTSFGNDPALDAQRALAVLLMVRADANTLGGSLTEPATRALLELELAFRSHGCGNAAAASDHLKAAFTIDPRLEQDGDRVLEWLMTRVTHNSPTRNADGHRAALRWIEAGMRDTPPPKTESEANFSLFLAASVPLRTRHALAKPLADLQLLQAAYAAEREGDVRGACRLALRALLARADGTRSRSFGRLLLKILLGKSLGDQARRLRCWLQRPARGPS